MEEWYRINNIEEVDSPALVIYPERVKKYRIAQKYDQRCKSLTSACENE